MSCFDKFDFDSFWKDSEYARDNYECDSPSDEMVQSIENQLGYKLPDSYIEFMKVHNGGIPKFDCFPTNQSTSWADGHVAITGFYSLSRRNGYSLGHEYGSQCTVEEWGYPKIGIMICDCPSAGHDIIMLDYSKCGKEGEPEVVHVDQECGYKITLLAKSFEEFVKGLRSSEEFQVE